MYGDGTCIAVGPSLGLLNGDVDGFMKDHARSEQLCCAGSAKMGADFLVGDLPRGAGWLEVLTNDHAS